MPHVIDPIRAAYLELLREAEAHLKEIAEQEGE